MTTPAFQPESGTPYAESQLTPLPGMPFFNRLLGGGIPSGQLIGLVAPTGGGKTLLGMQAAFAMTMLNKHIVYVGIERGNQFPQRFSKLINGAFTGNDEKITKQKDVLRERIGPFFCMTDPDHFEPATSCADIVAELESAPDLIVVDQLELWIMGRGITPSQGTISAFCTELKEFAHQSGRPVLLLHQTKSELKTSPSVRKPTTSDAMHSTIFGCEDVDTCIFLSPLNPQNVCWMSNPAEGRHELVWLDGDRGRFRSMGPIDDLVQIHWSGKYQDGQKLYDFAPTVHACFLGGDSPEQVCALLDGSKPISQCAATLSIEPEAATGTSEDEPVTLTDHELNLLLSAANVIAPALTLEHGQKMIALTNSAGLGNTALTSLALWCRCNGRRDFIDLIGHTEQIASEHSSAELRCFHQWVLEQAEANGWNGEADVPEFASVPEDAVCMSHLFDSYCKQHSHFLECDWHNHRLALAERASVLCEGSDCEVKLGKYGKKNNRPLTWNRARKLFLDKGVSPPTFLMNYANRYRAIPWPASFPVLVKPLESPPVFEPRYEPAYPDQALQILLHDDLLPWEIALLTLYIGARWPIPVNFASSFHWALLSYQAIGNEQLTLYIEEHLSPFVRRATLRSQSAEDREEQPDCDRLR